MEIYNEIEQGTPEWHELKYRKIGGTRSKGLHTKGDTLMIELLSEFCEPFELEDGFTSDAMQRGHELEPIAREQLESLLNVKFGVPAWIQSKHPLLGISPDGVTSDMKIACEIKSPGRKKHTEIIFNDCIPTDYVHQLVHFFTVNDKLEKLVFCSFRPESEVKPLFYKIINRDTLVNFGTKSRPNIQNVQFFVNQSIELANKLNEDLKNNIEKLQF